MNTKEFADFCTELGYLYEQIITDESVTKDYTGELDVVAASRGEEACWTTRDVVTVASKKISCTGTTCHALSRVE